LPGTTLTHRAVNRATLARQHLLARADSAALDEIAHLAGMQAQAPLAPYVGLWTRLRGFTPADLSVLYQQRRVVRLALMRSTIHLVTVDDALAWRPLVEPVIVRSTNSTFAKHYDGLDRRALAEAARELIEQAPRTFAELGALLAERFPGRDPAALAQAARAHVPLVQIPPRGLWGASGRIAHTTAQSWLGRDVHQSPDPDAMILRYLAAFGPATVMDAQAWSGLTRLREVFDRLRPALRVDVGENGAQLFDLPDAPRPDPDTPAPARFLPEYDNLLFSHADRTRVNPAAHRIPLFPGNGAALGYYLLDGVWAGLWRTERSRSRRTAAGPDRHNDAGTSTRDRSGTDSATATTTEAVVASAPTRITLTVQYFEPPAPAARNELTDQGLKLLALLAPDAPSPEIRFAPAP
jgi:hypothetical protein